MFCVQEMLAKQRHLFFSPLSPQGHSKSYIQSISSGRAMMPSMGEFLAICEYLNVTPCDFFDEQTQNPVMKNHLIAEISKLSESDADMIL